MARGTFSRRLWRHSRRRVCRFRLSRECGRGRGGRVRISRSARCVRCDPRIAAELALERCPRIYRRPRILLSLVAKSYSFKDTAFTCGIPADGANEAAERSETSDESVAAACVLAVWTRCG